MARVFTTSLVGVTFKNRQENVAKVGSGQRLFWRRDAENEFDKNAIMVYTDFEMKTELGHFRRLLAEKIAPKIDRGSMTMEIFAKQVTGGGEGKSLGLNVNVFMSPGSNVESRT